MEYRFCYNEPTPTYESYKELLVKMKIMSKEFKSLDKVFKLDFDYKLIKEYEKQK